ncbi:Ditrans,polycis-undecaprenyl-diphosphate synthase ((2E,6E)-farnesyl-diphosphate specific) [Methyloligella halotolerans]|uniref:Isoprenyl transferase n=1 Tax=Methyloligella halotolerans TaxID=1177755 RepID=A0A1E2S245_9HYPH|nr:isoprenyl transferase [Methyloligella halotolerans]ODA68492.1 Ditrans,polycis-undecaprenyl-diphosphate synthase ((2E,6E)-farnesyl-diphosphate specific) [Methyloligella halotolerans]
MTFAMEEPGLPSAEDTGPGHVAIIMDGNGRWAQERGLPRTEGHRRGVDAVRRTVQAAMELGLTHLTLFSFSSENWSRPKAEIRDLFGLMRMFVRRDLADLHKHGVRINVIGSREGLENDVLKMIDDAVALTKDNDGLVLTIAFNYGARDEIARAARKIAEQVEQGALSAEDVTQETVAANLDTADLPDPNLLIRTSGELRLSNFLLWQLAYAEFVFVDTYWPDFNRDTLEGAIAEYQQRSRRFGGVTARSTA